MSAEDAARTYDADSALGAQLQHPQVIAGLTHVHLDGSQPPVGGQCFAK